MAEMQFDWAGLLKLLAENLYNKKQVFIRELIQNAHDAIQRRAEPEAGRVEIEIDHRNRRLCIMDNGIGMNEADLHNYLSTIGIGATRLSKKEGLVGHFGIGFLSAFIVADRVEVVTRREGEAVGYRWRNTGSREYTITESGELASNGTRVEVYVRAEEVGILNREEVVAVVEEYCDMLRIPITIRGESQPLNRMTMPWEASYSKPKELELQTRFYLYNKLGGDALEIIPIRRNDLNGVLYITKTRVVGVNSPQTVRLYVQRMLVAENLPSLLPSWATAFVSGFINSSTLKPTAARDNVKTGDEFEAVKEVLGNIIVEHLDGIRQTTPERFSEIQKYHWLGLRSACANYPEFFDKFADLLEWKTNTLDNSTAASAAGVALRTLPEIIRLIEEQDPSAPFTSIRCFGSANSVNHVFQMAKVAKSVVIDASPSFDLQLLKAYVSQRGSGKLRLVRIDEDDDPLFFRPVLAEEEPEIVELANAMSSLDYVSPSKVIFHPRILARRFEPATLPAIIRQDEKASGKLDSARAMLEDPSQPQDVRDLAEAYVKEAEGAMCLALNASNPFVQRLAQQDFTDPAVRRLMTALYNSAFLSSGSMSPYNASVLHGDMMYFLSMSLENAMPRKDVVREFQTSNIISPAATKRHSVFFMITPFAERYRATIEHIRSVVEDKWGAELLIASDLKLDDRIIDSIRQHVDMADGFIVEVSEANPNVMFELGYIFERKRSRPIINLASSHMQSSGESRLSLPSDIQGMIYVDYKDSSGDALCELFDAEAKKDPRVNAILNRAGRLRFVSARKVNGVIKVLSMAVCKVLASEFPTADDWKSAKSESFSHLLPVEYRAMADILLKRMLDGLTLH